MPRKIRHLKADLQRAGFAEDPKRGADDHSWWEHPDLPGVIANLDGKDGDAVRYYQEKQVRIALRAARALQEGRQP